MDQTSGLVAEPAVRTGTWQVIWHEGIDGAHGLAVDEAALGWVARRPHSAVLHLYQFDPPCVVIGYHQDPRTEADMDVCRSLGVAIHRRLTGGGSILMGPGQLGLALALPRAAVAAAGGFGPVFDLLSQGIIWALRQYGVDSVLRPKNDLAVGGRKICGVGAYTDAAGMLMFHASTLVSFDHDLMLRVLRIPEAKYRDKLIASVREGMTTLEEQVGTAVDIAAFAGAVEEGFRVTLGVATERSPMTARQTEDVATIAAGRYRDPGWLHLGSRPGTRFTQASRKTVGGMLMVRIWKKDDRISDLQVRGDFFAERGVIEALESCLRGAAADEVRARVTAALPAELVWLVSVDDITAVVVKALGRDGVEGGTSATACFVPQEARG